MKNILPILFLFIGFFLSASDLYSQDTIVLKGTANYYSDKFHGRKTYNSEKYDKNAFTAANATLPMNTWVKVTNLKNGKVVVVRINDRCSNNAKRVIDLSKAAAKEIDMIRDGVVVIEKYVAPK